MTSPSPYPETMTKAELVTFIHKGREEFNAVWRPLTAAQMTRRPGPTPLWSVKDLIAHLTWWETYTMARVTLLLAGEEVLPLGEFDGINVLIHSQVKDLPLDEVIHAFEANLLRLEAHIALMTEEQLNDAVGFKSHGRSPLVMLGGNTFGHYSEHQQNLLDYVTSLKD